MNNRIRHATRVTLVLFALSVLLIGNAARVFAHDGETHSPFNFPTPPEPVEGPLPESEIPADQHAQGDEALAEAAQEFPKFVVDYDNLRVAAPTELNQLGEWGPILNWPHIPVTAATLPDGRLLTFASNRRDAFPGGQPEFTYAATWDPATNTFVENNFDGHDLFCGFPVMNDNGQVLISGGRNTTELSTFFDFTTDSWVPNDPMNDPRWYPTALAMPENKVFIASGSGGPNSAELYTPDNGWTLLNGIDWSPIADWGSGYSVEHWFPQITLAPDGDIIYVGPTPIMREIDTSGSGSMTPLPVGISNWDSANQTGTSVMFDEGKVLTLGGRPNWRETTVVDINGAVPTVTLINDMLTPRSFANTTMMPNGEVFVVGGNTSGIGFSDEGTILTPEIWNPTTGQWREVADHLVPRNYHSVALLLTDGRIFSGGGGLCGSCAANHQDAQVYSPPYLFNGDGTLATRPNVSNAPPVLGYNATFSVDVDQPIQTFSFIRMSSTTHGNNTDQRYLSLPFTDLGNGEYEITTHSNVNVMTPGYWMLFAVNDQGVPSVASVIQVTTSNIPTLNTPSPKINGEGDTVALQIEASDPNFDTLTYSAVGLPNGLTINSGTGLISGVLAAGSAGAYNVIVTVTDGNSPVNTSFLWDVFDGPVLLSAEFDSDSETATYIDDAFRNTAQPLYASGAYSPTGGLDGGGLSVTLGGLDDDDILGMSGGWQISFSVPAPQAVTLSFDFNLTIAQGYEVDEFGEALLLVDGVLVGIPPNDYLAQLSGDGDTGPETTTGWQAVSLDLGQLSSGTHTLIIGAHNNKKTFADETTTVLIDNVLAIGTAPTNEPPIVTSPGNQLNAEGDNVSLQIVASDPEDDTLMFAAAGLPSGLSIDANSGLISGQLLSGSAGSHSVTVTVDDGNGGSDSVNFTWTVNESPLTIQPITSPPEQVGSVVQYTALASGGVNRQYNWNFGDGTGDTGPSTSPTINHTFTSAGIFNVSVTVTEDGGDSVTMQFVQAIHEALTPIRPNQSSTLYYQTRSGADYLWNVNPDNNTVSVFNTVTHNKVAEIPVGTNPRALGLTPDGQIWVINKRSASISVIDTSTLIVISTINLPYGSQPAGLVFDPTGPFAYITLEATGHLLKMDPDDGSTFATLDVGPNPRHLSITGDGATIYLSRFISPPLPGEDTANPQTDVAGQPVGGEVLAINTNANMSIDSTIVLQHSEAPDTQGSGRGIPNYLGAPAISPDGLSAWVPSKQDNILRGVLRDGLNLDHDNTVRPISSRIDLSTHTEDVAARIDHNDAAVPSAAAYGPFGVYLFTALEGNRQIMVSDAHGEADIFHFDVGRAPQGVLVSPDGTTLYTHNFMDRSVSVHNITAIIDEGENSAALVTTYDAVAVEVLAADVLLGKQLFYDAQDPRLALEGYISCASCHNDGGDDGRVWDFTGMGEGLRNTITLLGRSGLGHGPQHWTGNFDETQDFEAQIRNLAGGTGLMDDIDFFASTTSQPLGDPKAGLSADLDALAAYIASLSQFDASPNRNSNGTLTSAGVSGRAIFEDQGCVQCHSGEAFSDSELNVFHDVGTLTSASGERLGQPLTGLDTPTLRGVWQTAPYLHDGSAATLADAVNAHTGVSVSAAELNDLVAFLSQIDGAESAPSNQQPIVTNPGNQTATVTDNVSLQIDATDPENADLIYTATGLPGGLSIGSNTGLIGGVPTQPGLFNVTVTVDDLESSPIGISFDWTINDVAPPVTCNTRGLLHEWWDGVPGAAIVDLTSLATYPASPTGFNTLTTFEIPANVKEDYGVRLRGYIEAPETGSYTFWIASDDHGELWLSSDSNPANAALIASVSDWTAPLQFDKFAEQQSAEITLQAGEYYYIEALMKEWWGGDNLAVAWQTPSDAQAVIANQYLCLYELLGAPPTAAFTASPTSGTAPITVDFDGTASEDPDGTIVSYLWQFGDGSSASGSTVSFTYDNPGSYVAQLTVTDNDGRLDTTALTINVSSDGTTCGTPGLLHEWWNDIPGDKIADLTSDPAFPNSPDGSGELLGFEVPTNINDNYGVRVRGLIYPPVTGDYIFWIASDDNGSLLLGSNDQPNTATEIASVPGWTPPQQWDWHAEQQSDPITLIGGQPYYIEALMKEWGGGDNLAVAWQIPGGTRQLIPSVVTCPYEPNGALPTAVISADNTNGEAPLTVNFDGTTSDDPDGTIVSYDWVFGDGATASGSTVTHTYTDPGAYTAQLTVTDNDGNTAIDTVPIAVNSQGSVSCNTNGLLMEHWLDVDGNKIADLTSDPDYPDSPDGSEIITDFDASLQGEDYGLRVRGFIIPPTTGQYTFFIASDDEGRLLLSNDATASNASEIASVPDWAPYQNYTIYPSQVSAEITLLAGQAYYIEALMKEGFGGDHLTVAWQPPGGSQSTIPNINLCTLDGIGGTRSQIAPPRASQSEGDELIPVSLSNVGQSLTNSQLEEIMLILSADSPLNEEAQGVLAWFDLLRTEDMLVSAEIVDAATSVYDQFYEVASPSLRLWLESIWDVAAIDQHIGHNVNDAWDQVNNSVVPNAVIWRAVQISTANSWPLLMLITLSALTITTLWARRRKNT